MRHLAQLHAQKVNPDDGRGLSVHQRNQRTSSFESVFVENLKRTLAAHLLGTYLLAVGDRHTGNLKVTSDG